ncbi:MAG: hypothetical protein PHR53_06770 [Bacteroidales bacterium]|nr:hypothetical protein [Bacteroidales bacterium]
MKKSLVFSCLAVIMVAMSFVACNQGEEEANVQFQSERDSLQQIIDAKDQAINDFMNDFMEIQNALNAIKEKENIVTIQSTQGEINQVDAKENIQQDIRDIYQLLSTNKKKISDLRKKLKNSNSKIEGLENMVANLEAQITARDKDIADLRAELEKKNIQIAGLENVVSSMNEQVAGMSDVIDEQQAKLNTAWYRLATKKALKEEGVIDKKGEVVPETNPMFQKVDITTFKEVPVYAAKAEILTSHPAESYEIITVDKQVEKIIIKDPEAFWSVQKRLVVQVKY